jgi:hypothetical protein
VVRSPIRCGRDHFDRGNRIPRVLRLIGRLRRKMARQFAEIAVGRAAERSRSVHGSAVAPTPVRTVGCQRRTRRVRDRCDAAPVPPRHGPAERPTGEAWLVAAGSTGPPVSAHWWVPVPTPIPVRPNRSERRARAFPRAVSAGGGQASAASLRQEAMRAWRQAWHRENRRGQPRDRVCVPTS